MTFNRKSTLALVAAALGACAWLAGAATSNSRDPVAPPVVRRPAVDVSGAALAAEVARLHERLRPSAAPRQPGRNLFSFSAAQVSAPAPPPPPPSKPALSEANASRPAAPSIKLSGIAEDVTDDGVVRTAIISAFGQLFVVKEGEPVTGRYRVAKISADVVELSDVTERTVLRFALK
jgi:hypothetical protein